MVRRPDTLDLPNTTHVDNAYDAAARLTATDLRTSAGAILDAHGYPVIDDADRRRRETRTVGGTTTSIDYVHDALGQLVGASAREPDGSTLRRNEQFGFTYDPAGNPVRRTNDQFVVAFTVDSRNQLGTASASGSLTVAGSTSGSASNVSDGWSSRNAMAPTTPASPTPGAATSRAPAPVPVASADSWP